MTVFAETLPPNLGIGLLIIATGDAKAWDDGLQAEFVLTEGDALHDRMSPNRGAKATGQFVFKLCRHLRMVPEDSGLGNAFLEGRRRNRRRTRREPSKLTNEGLSLHLDCGFVALYGVKHLSCLVIELSTKILKRVIAAILDIG